MKPSIESSNPHVSVVIPTHNRLKLLIECLESVYSSGYEKLEVIVVDDGSSDGTSNVIPNRFPLARVLRGNGKLWWSGAMNIGIGESLARGADYVLPLNDDVQIEANAISSLVRCARENDRTIVGSLILYKDRPIVWCAGGELKWPWPGEKMIGCGEENPVSFEGVREVEWTPGMGTLIPTRFFTTHGAYDEEHMPQYLADADLTLRARRAGYRVLVTSKSILFNRVESTGGISVSTMKITPREALDIFTSRRSSDYVPARIAFMLRHCPRQWLILAILIRYTRLLVFILRRLSFT